MCPRRRSAIISDSAKPNTTTPGNGILYSSGFDASLSVGVTAESEIDLYQYRTKILVFMHTVRRVALFSIFGVMLVEVAE